MRKVLVVVDMQNDFIDGSLGNKDAIAIVSNVSKKIEEYHKNGHVVIFTRDTHGKDYLNTMEGKNLPVEHCIKGTYGWEISSKLDVADGDTIIDKPTFGSNELAEYMEELDFDVIEIIGLCTDICVITNAFILKTKFPEKEIIVDSACCAGVTPESHKNALNAMEACQIVIK